MIIQIPLPTKVSTNAIYAGMHWAKRKALADEYHMALIEYRGKKITIPTTLNFTFTFKSKWLDCTNCGFMAKLLEDSLVINKIIPNDTPDIVESINIRVIKGDRDSVMIESVS